MTASRGCKPEGDRHAHIPAHPFGYPEEAPVDRADPVCFCLQAVSGWTL